MSYKVFISHSSRDSDLARDLARRLQEAGVETFLPAENLQVGQDVMTKINRALRNSDEVVVLLTDHSVNNPNITLEMGAALGMHKLVTPISVGINRDERLAFFNQFSHVSYADVSDYIAQLRERANEHANGKEAIRK
ncbi:MAG: toll/interleukin-1 receptor domain-containing protein [Armatimonadota bacterium]|nr:toll/interleukin-1 receptor domain-containing protein [Armatimonadota bacterium]